MVKTITVWSCCTYPGTRIAYEDITQPMWAAKKFVSAIKGTPFKGYANVPVKTSSDMRRLESRNMADAFSWYSEMVARTFMVYRRPVILVPVPPSKATTRVDSAAWRTTLVAQALQQSGIFPSCRIDHLLTWKTVLPSAKSKGPRDPQVIRKNCSVRRVAVDGRTLLLVDDVMTKGGHFAGCGAALRDALGAVPASGFCVGRTVEDQETDPFKWKSRQLEIPD